MSAEGLRNRLRDELDHLLADAHGVPDEERDEWAAKLAAVAAPALPAGPEDELENAKADAFQSGYNKGFNDGRMVESNRPALPAGLPDVERLAAKLQGWRKLGNPPEADMSWRAGWNDCIASVIALLGDAALEGSATLPSDRGRTG